MLRHIAEFYGVVVVLFAIYAAWMCSGKKA